MNPSAHRVLRFAGAVVAVSLLALAFYPGTLADPYVTSYDPHSYTHAIVPASSSQYEDVTGTTDPPVYQYESLSPVAKEMVDRTLASDTRSRYTGGREFVPQVCRNFMVVCDGYRARELPAEFTYGMQLSTEESHQIVEKDGERYLLKTGSHGHYFFGPAPFGFLTAVVTMPPLAILVALAVGTSGRDRIRAGILGFGALVAVLGVLAPYLQFYGLASVWDARVVVLGSVWLAILCAVGYRLWRAVANRRGRGRPDKS